DRTQPDPERAQGHEVAQIGRKQHGHRRIAGAQDDRALGPSVEEAPQRAVRLGQIHEHAARARKGGAQLGNRERARQRKRRCDEPHEKLERRRRQELCDREAAMNAPEPMIGPTLIMVAASSPSERRSSTSRILPDGIPSGKSMRLIQAAEAQLRERDRVTYQAWGGRLTPAEWALREERLRAHAWSRAGLAGWLLTDQAEKVLASCETYRMQSCLQGAPGAPLA